MERLRRNRTRQQALLARPCRSFSAPGCFRSSDFSAFSFSWSQSRCGRPTRCEERVASFRFPGSSPPTSSPASPPHGSSQPQCARSPSRQSRSSPTPRGLSTRPRLFLARRSSCLVTSARMKRTLRSRLEAQDRREEPRRGARPPSLNPSSPQLLVRMMSY